jgi:flagellar protein FliO/FliZ
VTSSPSIWPALTAFAAVIALIPLSLWLLKRLQSHRTSGARSITVAGGLSLGPRERIVIIESQGRRWMLGVTAQSISLIAELDPDQPVSASVGAPVSTPVKTTVLACGDPGTAAVAATATSSDAQRPFGELLDRIKRHD